MFGFIRPVKPELRVKEADRFQQVYCGLCHAIRARYGRFYTLFLSYDMTFFALVAGCGESGYRAALHEAVRRASGHQAPLRAAGCALETAADVSVLLTYHKIRDSSCGRKGRKARAGRAAVPAGQARLRTGARASAGSGPRRCVQALADLQTLEREKCASMDRAADASARMTEAVVPRTGDARERVLRQMFYHIGRWVYLLDAAQDVTEDWSRIITIRSCCATGCARRISQR